MGFIGKLADTAALGMLPKMMGLDGKNAGFALGIAPGLLYRDKYNSDAEEEAAKQQAAAQGKQEQNAGAPMKKGGKVRSASARADGIAQRGKTRGKMV